MTFLNLICRNNHRLNFSIFFFLLLFISCAPVYNPNNLFMPGLKERGDIAAEVYLGSSDLGAT